MLFKVPSKIVDEDANCAQAVDIDYDPTTEPNLFAVITLMGKEY